MIKIRSRRRKMKSAYELAMERLEKKAPSVALTDEQKQQIAEIDSTFKARIAEKELFLKDQISKAQSEGKAEEAESLQKQLTIDVRRLQEDAEAKKEKLRASFVNSVDRALRARCQFAASCDSAIDGGALDPTSANPRLPRQARRANVSARPKLCSRSNPR